MTYSANGSQKLTKSTCSACRKQSDAEICQEPSKLFDACCNLQVAAKTKSPKSPKTRQQASVSEQVTTESGRSEAKNAEDGRDGGTADFYLSIQTFTKHVSQKTYVHPREAANEKVARALHMLLIVLMATLFALVAMLALLWRGRSRSTPKASAFVKRSISGNKIPAF